MVITNGFAQTEVTQTFHNPNDVALEAVYVFPLPKSASLSELTITAGERELHGEVVVSELTITGGEPELSTTPSRSRAGRYGGS